MISWKHHLLAICVALSLHLIAALVLTGQAESGARAAGEAGIEIDLGMLGDLGVAQANQDAKPVTAPTEPVQPEVTEARPEPIPEPVAEIKPLAKAEADAIQVKTPSTQKPVKQPEPAKPEPLVPKPQPDNTSVAVSEQSTQSQTTRKQSTGSSHSLTNGGTPAAVSSYYSLIAAHLAKHKRYPVSARRRGEEGRVDISFTLASDGHLLGYQIVNGSGYAALDKAVEKMLKTASPLPPFPASISGPELTIRIPIEFRLNH
ncbi:energy transducer TonB [Neptuniibacter sp. CAU 1671]|uniref:energy transducer TonB n=1 Tax=Neptuniibacter sp. CAU 1671 TaxID=3032593 RepID=UPI0023DC886F|nr:energy transducer TonB [Neptuniibacter sp. CAU 1671]MDF2182815.1 energy transducer TonB [Neptuniibacter sp. CAU 1671]